jgi:YesN/AraC family two-component response regulator
LSKSPSGYFVQPINGENYVVTFVNLNGQNFKFIKLTPYRIVQQKPLKIRNSIIAVTLIILILGLVIIAFLSFGIYKPFKKLFKTKEALESFKWQNLYSIKEKLLLQFLTSADSNSIEYWNEQFAELQIKLNLSKKLMLCILKIDHYTGFIKGKTESELALSLFSICNISGEVFSASFNNESVITGDDHITLILEASLDEKPSHELLEKVQMMIKQYLDISVTITISHMIYNLDELSFQYSETLEMSNYRFIKGHAAIITPDNVPEATNLNYEYPYAKEQDLINYLLINKIANAKQTYLEIVESIQYCPYYEIQSIFNHLTIIINKAIKNMKSLLNIEFSFHMNLFNNELNSKETLYEINDLFISLFDKLSDEISLHSSSKSGTKYVKLVEDAKKYIDDNFYDTNLSLTSVADYFCSSSEYFGRLFKKYTLLSVQDYINQIRLNAAKKLLEGNDIQASEVYSKVGFVNKSHFYAFFKKSIGVTPGEYRDQAVSR